MLLTTDQLVEWIGRKSGETQEAILKMEKCGADLAVCEREYERVRYTEMLSFDGTMAEKEAHGRLTAVSQLEARTRAQTLYDAARRTVELHTQELRSIQTVASTARAEMEATKTGGYGS